MVCSSVPCVAGEPCVRTLAGTGTAGRQNGAADRAHFTSPKAIALDGRGALYVSDDHVVRKIQDGQVTTLAGDPDLYGDQDGPAAEASFDSLRGIAVDSKGVVHVVDRGAGKLRRIDNGMVSTVAIASEGALDPLDVATDGSDLYLVDHGHVSCMLVCSGVVRRAPSIGLLKGGKLEILPETITLTELRQDTTYLFAQPQAVAIGPAGVLYMPTAEGVRLIARDGTVKDLTIDPASAISDLAVDAQGVIYGVAPFVSRVGLLDLEGKLTTIPPLPEKLLDALMDPGCVDGPASVARFAAPMGIAVEANGSRIYVADSGNRRIRVIER